MATTAVGVIALGWLAGLPPVPYREPMKTIFHYRDDQIVVTVAKQKGAYIGTYASPLSALEEMAGTRPQLQIVIRHPSFAYIANAILEIGVPDDGLAPDHFNRMYDSLRSALQDEELARDLSEADWKRVRAALQRAGRF